jgi:heat shock protein HslJ/membrane-bound inhibitor of C-type lysozyme
MKIQHIVAIILLLVMLLGVVRLIGNQGEPQSVFVSPQEIAFLDRAEAIRYQGEDGEIVVKYADELVQIVGGNYDQVVLRQVPAASGVKYEGEQGLTLWTKGDEVRIETPQELIFVGNEVHDDVMTEVPNEDVETPVATTSTAIGALVDIKWIWKQAIISGEVVTAQKPEEFSVTFTAEGQVTGDTDCNGFGGTYTQDTTTLTLGDFMSTLMFCEDSQEEVFRGLFASPLSIETVSAEALSLRNANGDTIEFTKGE